LADLDDQRLIYFKDELLRTLSLSTVSGYLAHVRSALTSAVEWGMLPHLPKMPKVKRLKGVKLMRGRAVTAAEFEQMIAVTPQAVGDAATPSWQFLLRGLWASGLRLGEACELHWDGYRGHVVDLVGKRPMFVIRGELEKGRRDRRLPIAPEFAELLATIVPNARTGRVFRPAAKRAGAPDPQLHRVGETIALIGELAGVVVDADPRTGALKKYASAHDLRRAFGYRWAKRVIPAVLQRLMRHASIQTTMQYYVDLEAEDVADVVWAAASNTFSNSGQNGPTST
jgi:integrase